MNRRGDWLRVLGGGCFINTAVTGLLVGLTAAVTAFRVNSIALPFLIGATVSFGLSLMLIRRSAEPDAVMRNALLTGAGVLLGSVAAVLGIAAYLLLAGV